MGGRASWPPKKGIVVLRNPSDKPQSIANDLAKALELPVGAPDFYSAKSPWKADEQTATLPLKHAWYARGPCPFEVLTLELEPK
jgi:hypothetical protein